MQQKAKNTPCQKGEYPISFPGFCIFFKKLKDKTKNQDNLTAKIRLISK